MSSAPQLSQEQKAKIEENKAKALALRKLKSSSSSSSSQSPPNSQGTMKQSKLMSFFLKKPAPSGGDSDNRSSSFGNSNSETSPAKNYVTSPLKTSSSQFDENGAIVSDKLSPAPLGHDADGEERPMNDDNPPRESHFFPRSTTSPTAVSCQDELNTLPSRQQRETIASLQNQNVMTGLIDDDSEDDRPWPSVKSSLSSAAKKRKVIDDDSDEEYNVKQDEEEAAMESESEGDMDDFIVDDEEDDDDDYSSSKEKNKKKKRKNNSKVKNVQGKSISQTKSPTQQFLTTSSSKKKETPPTSKNQESVLNTKRKLEKFLASPSKEENDDEEENDREEDDGSEGESKSTTKSGNKDAVRHPWLVTIRDRNRRTEDDPEYDPSTLYVPETAFTNKSLTPFEIQYWRIKKDLWDTILFFKKGKFFELYEKDADIGHQLFDLKMTDRVNMKMVGVPEARLEEWTNKFLAKGYRVAKVEERETALAKEIREKKSQSKSASKIIERKLTAVHTQGTLMGDYLVEDMSSFIMALCEQEEGKAYGVCFADTGTASFYITSFEDDSALTTLETLIVQIRPKEIVHVKGGLSQPALSLIKAFCPGAAVNRLTAGTEFWDAATTVEEITRHNYFPERWPEALESMKGNGVALSAFGGLVFYLRKVLLDKVLLEKGRFMAYSPLRDGATLLLDGQTLLNLEILQNNYDGSSKGSLIDLLCHTVSPFGKRMFRTWLVHPLRHVADIEQRYEAIDDLERSASSGFPDKLMKVVRGLPDLERMIARVHVGQCRLPAFLAILEAFETLFDFIKEIQKDVQQFSSTRLKALLTIGELFPDLEPVLEHFRSSFNHREAKSEGVIVPSKGVYPELDEAVAIINSTENLLDAHLKDMKALFKKDREKIVFYHPKVGTESHQIQVPVSQEGSVPRDWTLKSNAKSVKRYWTPKIESMMRKLSEAKETKSVFQKDVLSNTLKDFDSYSQWLNAVRCISEVDCLVSLWRTREVMGQPACRPTLISPSPGHAPVLDVADLRHPCVLQSGSVSDYIPNNTTLGGEAAPMLILTGPNMGGKSTLLRQTCIAVIMAQLGCYVPASSFRLTPVDRIFTRIGANDNIIAGRSTFMVELKETASIVKNATHESLVILDELGRGTSTFDGYAIAYSVLSFLLDSTKCRGMFATHYHHLTEEFKEDARVALGHMACDVSPGGHDVTFLYKLMQGVCSKSYGMNVARMAGLPKEVIENAILKAAQFEATSKYNNLFERQRAHADLAKKFSAFLQAEPQGLVEALRIVKTHLTS